MPTKDKKTIVLLDAHAILHRAYHALPQFSTSDGKPTGALYGLSAILIKLINDLTPDYLVACYDLPEPTHRHQVYEDYKSGRGKADEELVEQIKDSRDIFEAFGIPIYEASGFEADDVLGTITSKLEDSKDLDIIIASGDMDTLQLVQGSRVRVYTMKQGIKNTVLYDEKAVKDRFGFSPKYLVDFKGLSGDPSDNIPGIHGIGEKTASHLIQNFGHLEEIYKTLDKKPDKLKEKGVKDRIINLLRDCREEAEFSKALATIRMDAPVSFKIPDKVWSKGVDTDRAREIFQHFEFRNLYERLTQALGSENTDTLISEEEEKNINQKDLKETALALWLVKSDITNPDYSDVLSFANTNSYDQAKEIIFNMLEEQNLKPVFENIEKPIIPVVEKMNKRGVKIDRKYLEKLSSKYHSQLEKIEKEIFKLAGREFNVNSPKQLAEIIFDELGLSVKNHKKTPTGARSTKESELRKLEGEPIIDYILQHRELSKLLGTYIDAIRSVLDENDRLHAEFIQAGTTTGRMASKHPNLQNIPIRTEQGRAIRNSFIASPGYLLAAFDYSQIELRVAAILSEDKKMINVFKNQGDIHQAVASEVFEVKPEEVDKEMRRKAKVINFGIIYGMGVSALKENLKTERKEAQEFYNKYFEKFSGLASYLEDVKQRARRNGFTQTLFNRRRYFEGIDSNLPQIRASAERMAINAPIQGTAADILKIAMKEAHGLLEGESLENKVHLLLQVHDELIYEISEEQVKTLTPRIRGIMESVMKEKDSKGVPLLVELETGPNWGEMKDVVDNR